MTKAEALEDFREYIRPMIVKKYGSNDKPAIREAWNNYTDFLCKNGLITEKQYNTWVVSF